MASTYSFILGSLSQTFRIGKGTTNSVTLTASSSSLAVNRQVDGYVYKLSSAQALTPSANAVTWSWAGSTTATRGMATLSLASATATNTITISNASVGQMFQLAITNHATAPVDVTLTPPSGFTFVYPSGKPTNLVALSNSSLNLLTFIVLDTSKILVTCLKDFKA